MQLQRRHFAAATVAVLFVGWTAAQVGAPPAAVPPGEVLAPPAGALVAPGDPADATIVFTGDVIGYLDPCG